MANSVKGRKGATKNGPFHLFYNTILYKSFQGPLANGKDGPSFPCICGFSTVVVVPEVHPRGDRPAIDHGAVLSAMLVVRLARIPNNCPRCVKCKMRNVKNKTLTKMRWACQGTSLRSPSVQGSASSTRSLLWGRRVGSN